MKWTWIKEMSVLTVLVGVAFGRINSNGLLLTAHYQMINIETLSIKYFYYQSENSAVYYNLFKYSS